MTTEESSDTNRKNRLCPEKSAECVRIMEDRKKERMKMLTRNLEVCDLLDMRNPQSVAEFAPAIYKFLHQQEAHHQYKEDFM